MCILFRKLLHTSLGKTHTRRERERERERALLGKLLVLILEHFSHGFCFTFQKKAAYFLRNYCIFFQESRYSKREIESEGDLLEKLLALSLVHISHGFCFYFFMKMCILFKRLLHSSLGKKKPSSKREREREREISSTSFWCWLGYTLHIGFVLLFTRNVHIFWQIIV